MGTPRDRIRVFISSAQNEENGFNWEDIRQKIKTSLSKCPYINPFIIEDDTSEIPSNQLFEFQVRKSDIVVLLIKGEVRKGTAREFAIAKKTQKPMLVYFCNEDMPNVDVAIIKKEIQLHDYCTYCGSISFDNIDNKILYDIIENIIQFYQLKHFVYQDADASSKMVSSEAESSPLKISAPTKTALAYFGSCYENIYDYLDMDYLKTGDKITAQSLFHQLGTNILKWLITGESFYNADNILTLIEKASDLYSDTQWLIKRWNAIKFRIAGNVEAALSSEQAALSAAQAANLPGWIINDILIDCRNFEVELNHKKRLTVFKPDSQAQLDKIETIVYLPVLDRYLEEAYEGITEEEIKHWIAPYGTTFYGTNICHVITNTENYLFSAVLYGSYTHIFFSRKAIARILYKYGKLTDDSEMFFVAVKLYLLQGDAKDFKQITLHEWDKLYSAVTANADEIWQMTERVDPIYKDSTKQAMLEILGLYLSDRTFKLAEQYIYNFANEVYWGNSEDYFGSIGGIIQRLDSVKLIIALTGILKDQRFHLGGKLSQLLIQLNVRIVPTELLQEFCTALTERLPFIIERNGDPQIIATLEKQNPAVFSVLATVTGNGLRGVQKLFYDINMNKGDWNYILAKEIDEASKQFEVNQNSNAYTYSFAMPYHTIIKIINSHFSSDMEETVSLKLFPLCLKVLKSCAPLPIKENCIMCLCAVLGFYKKQNLTIPQELEDVISSYNYAEESNFNFFSSSSKTTIAYRFLMLKVIIGIVKKEELFKCCFDYGKKEKNERMVLADCIDVFLRYSMDINRVADTMTLSIVFQFSEDEFFQIRQKACDCMTYMLNTKYHNQIANRLYEIAVDPSPYVRNYLLHICKRGEMPNKVISNQIIEVLKNDANYAIRNYALT